MPFRFRPGDYIKPTKNSRQDPEHWRYLVVRVWPDAMWAIDFHNNIMQIGECCDDSDFEYAPIEDPETLKDSEEAVRGELDYRFDHWEKP